MTRSTSTMSENVVITSKLKIFMGKNPPAQQGGNQNSSLVLSAILAFKYVLHQLRLTKTRVTQACTSVKFGWLASDISLENSYHFVFKTLLYDQSLWPKIFFFLVTISQTVTETWDVQGFSLSVTSWHRKSPSKKSIYPTFFSFVQKKASTRSISDFKWSFFPVTKCTLLSISVRPVSTQKERGGI